MKPVAIIAIACVGAICANAQPIKDTLPLNLPDSIKATAMMVTVQVPAAAEMRQQVAGIGANGVSLALYTGKSNHQVRLSFAKGLHIPAKGLDVTATQEALDWSFQPEGSGLYQLLLVAAGDSAENFMLYSGYLHFPSTRQWKLIGTCRVPHQWTTLKDLYRLEAMPRQQATGLKLGPVWCQRSNGSWMPLSPTDAPPPVLPPFSNIDSVQQFAQDSARVAHDMALGLTNVRYLKEGVFYEMLQTGSGPTVAITDTVSVFYKGYLYGDGKVFDQTKEKPARFPLARLIKGWQLGLPLCRVGGKIKLVILSGQAYAIRTRAAKIPPNSILVFEVEVIGVNR